MKDINDVLPPEIHLLILRNLSLEDLINYAAAHNSQVFFHAHRNAIWRALYRRDVSTEPLEGISSGDAYRKAYLKWRFTDSELYKRYKDDDRRLSKEDFRSTLQVYWKIMDAFHRCLRIFDNTRLGTPHWESQKEQFDREFTAYLQQNILESQEALRLLDIQAFIEETSWKKALRIFELWGRRDPDHNIVFCSTDGKEYFFRYLALLPEHLWEKVIFQNDEDELMTFEELYETYGQPPPKECRGGELEYRFFHENFVPMMTFVAMQRPRNQ